MREIAIQWNHRIPGVVLALLLFAPVRPAPGASMQEAPGDEGRWALLVTGISGSRELQQQFLREAMDLRDILVGSLGFPAARVLVLFDDPSLAPDRIQYKSTMENLRKACHEIAAHAGKDDLVFVYFGGHGSFDGKEYKLNLVGPDPAGLELAEMLDSIPSERMVVVNTTNSSGASLPVLARKSRIVITATRSGFERNQTRMAGFFIEAFRNGNADVDKNGRVSIMEAFEYASKTVEDYYSRENLLQSEHPTLDDQGGAAEADADPQRRGLLARTTYLDRGSPLWTRSGLSPEQQQLARRAQELEVEIEALKRAKPDMPPEEYEKKLESLLLRLAEIQAQLPKP